MKRSVLSIFIICSLICTGLFFQINSCMVKTPASYVTLGSASFPVANSVVNLSDSRSVVDIPIIMYHGISGSASEESEYFISQARFESDLKWYKENGYTTILPSHLIAYTENGCRLPAKPILLTFDDGYANNYMYAFPLLEKYNMKAVISLIGTDSDIASDDIYRIPENGNLSWGEVRVMSESGLIEFGNHSYDLHRIADGRKGADKKKGESSEAYLKLLADDLTLNNNKIKAFTGISPLMFAWPYGAYPQDENTEDTLRSIGIKMSVNSYQRTSSAVQGDPNSLYGMGRYLRTPQFSLDSIVPETTS